jgi:hypothetical protein
LNTVEWEGDAGIQVDSKFAQSRYAVWQQSLSARLINWRRLAIHNQGLEPFGASRDRRSDARGSRSDDEDVRANIQRVALGQSKTKCKSGKLRRFLRCR